MPVTKPCTHCGKPVTMPPSRVSEENFCSTACSGQYRSGSNSPCWKGGLTTLNCIRCGAEFQIKPSHIGKRGQGKYCSRKCSATEASRISHQHDAAKRVEKHCKSCGAVFSVKKSHALISTYCSKKCMYLAYKERMIGKGNSNYKHGMVYTREYVRHFAHIHRAKRRQAEGFHTIEDIERQYKSQRGKCYWCDVKVGKTYHVDHVIPLSRGGSNGPENIVIACVPCNRSKHAKLPTEWDGNKTGRLL